MNGARKWPKFQTNGDKPCWGGCSACESSGCSWFGVALHQQGWAGSSLIAGRPGRVWKDEVMLCLPGDASPYQVWFRPAQDLHCSVSPLNTDLKSGQWTMPSGTRIFKTSIGMRGWRRHKLFMVLGSRWIKFINLSVDFLPCLRYVALLILNLPFKSKQECFSCAQK